jgi:hypothetical protein
MFIPALLFNKNGGNYPKLFNKVAQTAVIT